MHRQHEEPTMADKTLRETVDAKYSRYEVWEHRSLLTSPKFYVSKNGKPHRGSFSRFDAAVAAGCAQGRLNRRSPTAGMDAGDPGRFGFLDWSERGDQSWTRGCGPVGA
jgi:hypothetical protein